MANDDDKTLPSSNSRSEDAVQAKLLSFIESLPEDQRKQVFGLQSQSISIHEGPLPSPKALAHYDEVRPGTADDLVKHLHSEQQTFRDALLKKTK